MVFEGDKRQFKVAATILKTLEKGKKKESYDLETFNID